jgi:hypothetical protein
MFSALFSFLGGSIFRMIWGEVSSFFQKKQDHEYEIARLQLQMTIDDKAAERQAANLRLQQQLGIQTIEVQRDALVATEEAGAFKAAMADAFKPTGYKFVDVWNGVIRPAAATIVLVLWFAKLASQGFVMDDYDQELSGVVLGFFFANRALGSRGK